MSQLSIVKFLTIHDLLNPSEISQISMVKFKLMWSNISSRSIRNTKTQEKEKKKFNIFIINKFFKTTLTTQANRTPTILCSKKQKSLQKNNSKQAQVCTRSSSILFNHMMAMNWMNKFVQSPSPWDPGINDSFLQCLNEQGSIQYESICMLVTN